MRESHRLTVILPLLVEALASLYKDKSTRGRILI